MKKKGLKIYFFGMILLIIMMSPAYYLDFKPSEAFAIESAILGGVIALIFLPFYKHTSNISTNTNSSFRRGFTAFIIMPLGVALLGYGASIGTIGFALNKIVGKQKLVIHTIKHKGCYRRRCLCNTKIHITSDSVMSNGEFCVNESLWKQVNVGQQLRVFGVISRFGFDVDKFEIVR